MRNGCKKLWIIGSGGHAKVVIDSARLSGGFEISGVLDDDPQRLGATVVGATVVGSIDLATCLRLGVEYAIIAIGNNLARRQISSKLERAVEWVSVVHPSAIVAESARIGEGSVICAGAIVQPETTIGRHAIVNTAASVDHDCRIEDFAHVAPGVRIAGNVRVGTGTLIGIGVSVVPGTSIGEWSVIGAGSTVIQSITSNVTAVGVPAAVIKERAPGWHLA